MQAPLACGSKGLPGCKDSLLRGEAAGSSGVGHCPVLPHKAVQRKELLSPPAQLEKPLGEDKSRKHRTGTGSGEGSSQISSLMLLPFQASHLSS